MENKFQKLMVRIKHTGIVVSNASPKSYYDPVDAKIYFVVPSIPIILRINESLQPIMPGVIILYWIITKLQMEATISNASF